MKVLLSVLLSAILFAPGVHAAKKSKKKAAPVPAFSTKSYLIADENGIIIKEKRSDDVRPIASISKLMIALLASEQNPYEELTIPSKRRATTKIPRRVKSLSRYDLLTLALVKSDNLAAFVLCSNLPNCVEMMNERAAELGMVNTKYVEPTGISGANVSTAQDLLKLATVAADNFVLSRLSSLPAAEIPTDAKSIKIGNTNPLTAKHDVVLSKTGTTTKAGGCILMVMDTDHGRRTFILLGSRNGRTRISDLQRLIKAD
jgi:D-alanyl-D-alanine endopeptidase (penicillin-binding protein 7)